MRMRVFGPNGKCKGTNVSSGWNHFAARRMACALSLRQWVVRAAVVMVAGFGLSTSSWAGDLFIYCCAGFRPPLEAIAAAFEQRHDVSIEMTFAGSGCLVAQAELAGRGDIFLPGEAHYIANAQNRGIVDETTEVAYLRPVIAVRKGNPRQIESLADLAKPGLRIGLGDPKSVAVGVATEGWFAAELDSSTTILVNENVITRAINVNELGNQLALGGIDAAIVWDVTVPLYKELEAIAPESGRNHRTVITGGVLKMSRNRELSATFLAFLAGPEGHEILRSFGYEPYLSASESESEDRADAERVAAVESVVQVVGGQDE